MTQADKRAYRVVLADDEDEFREWLRSLLEGSGAFQFVGEAGTGTEAIQLVAALRPDLVIADIYMPDLDGFDVARHLKRHFPEINVILVSARGEPIHERLARDEGALAFLPKTRITRDALCLALQGAE